MEMLLALAVSAIVLAGMGGVFFSALRLRERAAAMLDDARPLHHAITSLRRDLKGALPPGGLLAAGFRCGAVSAALGQSLGIQFATTTGLIQDQSPWSEVQEVTYELRVPGAGGTKQGKDLIRTTTRNLLSTTTLDYHEEWLLGGVERLEFECYDGWQWREYWDTSLGDTNLPVAVRVRLQMAVDDQVDIRTVQPFEMVIPLVTQSQLPPADSTLGGME
jgi:type II secretory pathway component PulJ